MAGPSSIRGSSKRSFRPARGPPNSPLVELTPREREVLAQMAQGKNNAAIAQALTLTTRAVERHINSVFAKLPLD